VSFGHPLLLLAVAIPVVAAALYVLALRRAARYPVRFTNLDVLGQVAPRRGAWRGYVPPALFLLAVIALCAALARPHVKTLVPDERATVILVLDASRSMLARDVRPNRLVAAEVAARTFLDRVPPRLRVALVVFSGDVQVATPPTIDHELVRESIADVGNYSGYGGTAIGDAIARAVELGQESVAGDSRSLSSAAARPAGDARGLVSIVFLSDGRQNRGLIPPLEGAARAKRAGIPVYTIALGTRAGALPSPQGGAGFGFGRGAPDPETLRQIARITGGGFFHARTAGSVEAAYEKLGTRLGRKPGDTEITFAFLIAAGAALVLAGLLSAVWSPRLP
jgi:Ca-activated chloride channel family protein